MNLLERIGNYFSRKKPEKDSSQERESFIADIKPHTGKLYPLGHASDFYLKDGSIVTVINHEYSLTEMLRREGLL